MQAQCIVFMLSPQDTLLYVVASGHAANFRQKDAHCALRKLPALLFRNQHNPFLSASRGYDARLEVLKACSSGSMLRSLSKRAATRRRAS